MDHVVRLGEEAHPTGFLWMDAEFDNLRAALNGCWPTTWTRPPASASRWAGSDGGSGSYKAGGWPARVIAARADPIDEVPADLLGAAVHGPLYGGDSKGSLVLAERALAAARSSTAVRRGDRAVGRRHGARDHHRRRPAHLGGGRGDARVSPVGRGSSTTRYGTTSCGPISTSATSTPVGRPPRKPTGNSKGGRTRSSPTGRWPG